jgi:protein O-mannosyl-transferase
MALPRHHGLAALVIVVSAVLAYANTFSSPFLFDDTPNITDNHLIRNWDTALHPEQYCSSIHHRSDEALICHFFKIRHVGYLSFALNYALNGLNVEGYHVVNFCIHLLNSLLVYTLVLLLQKTPAFAASNSKALNRAALFSSLLFVVHPLQTQAVTYIIQRLTSLATLFYLLSIISYLSMRLLQTAKAKGGGGQGFSMKITGLYLLSLISAVLAMKTKEISFTLPVMITLCEFIFFDDKLPKRSAYLVPLILTMFIIPLQLTGIDASLSDLFSDVSNAARVRSDMSRMDYLFTQSTVVLRYLQLLIFPVGQNVDYDYPVYDSLFHPKVLFSSLIILSLIGTGIYLLLRYRTSSPYARIISFGIFWFFLALSVESSLIPILDVIFEHRVYLPSVGFFIASAVSLAILAERLEVHLPWVRKAAPAAAGLIVMMLAGAAHARNMVWQDEVVFWSDVVNKSPNKPRGYLNLGLAYQNRKDIEKALAYYSRAIAMKKLYYPPLNNRGTILAALGQHEQAIRDFTDAISINPYVAVAYYNRGMSRTFLGQQDLAIEDFTRVIELKPTHAEAYNNRGSMYGAKGEMEKAIADFSSAIGLVPGFPGFYANRAHAYAVKQDFERAVLDLSRAIDLNPNEASWYTTRGTAYLSLRDREKAYADFRKACSLGDAGGCDALK